MASDTAALLVTSLVQTHTPVTTVASVVTGALRVQASRKLGRERKRAIRERQETQFEIVRAVRQTRPRTNAEWQEYWSFLRRNPTDLQLATYLLNIGWTQGQRRPGDRVLHPTIVRRREPTRPGRLSTVPRSTSLTRLTAPAMDSLSLPESLRLSQLEDH